MEVHYFTAEETRLLAKGLHMRFIITRDLIIKHHEYGYNTKLIDKLLKEALEMESLLNQLPTTFFTSITLLLSRKYLDHLYRAVMQINRYSESMIALWVKGGCKDAQLHFVATQFTKQTAELVASHFANYSYETSPQ